MWQRFGFIFIVIMSTVQGQPLSNGGCSPENIPQTDPSLCCNLDDFSNDPTVVDCRANFGHNLHKAAQQETPFPTGCCFSECILNSTGLLQETGLIDSPAVIKYMKGKLPNEPYEPSIEATINQSVTTCTKEVHVRKEDFDLIANLPPPPNGERICNPLSGHFIGCVHSHLFVNCPASRWTNSQECQHLKNYFIKCPLPFPMRAN